MAEIDEYAPNYKNLSIKLTDGSSIQGKVNLGQDFKRLSDYMKHSTEKFITVVSEGFTENSRKIFIINKNYIIWADTED